MLLKKTSNRFRAYPTHQAVQTTGSTAHYPVSKMVNQVGNNSKECMEPLKDIAGTESQGNISKKTGKKFDT